MPAGTPVGRSSPHQRFSRMTTLRALRPTRGLIPILIALAFAIGAEPALAAPMAPVITNPSGSPSPLVTNSNSVTIAGTAQSGTTITIYDGATQLTNSVNTGGGGTWTYNATLAEGEHVITAWATSSGETSNPSVSRVVRVDKTAPPAPSITTPATASSISATKTPTISGTAEAASTVRVRDGSTVVGTATADEAGNWSVTTSALAEGSRTITATATDTAGNLSSASPAKTIKVDSVAPAAPVISTPSANPYYSAGTGVTIAGTAEPASSVTLYDGAALLATVTTNGSGNWSYSATLAQGTHIVTGWANDDAGNTSPASGSKEITVDTTAPAIAIAQPLNGSSIASPAPNIVFSVTELRPSGQTECRVDSGSWSTCSSGYPLASLSDGQHTFSVRLSDLSGNAGSASTTFTVDTVAPVAPSISSGPSGPIASTSASFAFSGEAGGSFQCQLDTIDSWTACSSAKSYSSLSQGVHTFRVRQVDAAGNAGVDANRTFLVDTVGPAASAMFGPTGTVGTTNTAVGFANAENPVTFSCSLDGAPSATCTSPASLSGLSNGPHSFTVIATDALGNVGSPATLNWTVDSSLFAVAITGGPVGTVTEPANSFTFDSTISSGTTYMCKVDGGSFSLCSSPYATGPLADGTHTFSVYAINDAQTSNTASANWTVDTTGPLVSVSSPGEGATVATNGGISFTASDAAGTPGTTCAIDSDTPAPCGSPFPYSGLSGGAHSVKIVATDPVGNTSSFVRHFNVEATSPETTIDSGPLAITQSTNATFLFSSSKMPSTFECQLDGGSVAPCASGVAFNGLSEGSHSFFVRAIDEFGNVDPTAAGHVWQVDNTGPVAPSITSPVANLVTSNATPTISGLAEPGSTVTVRREGPVTLGTATADGSGNWQLAQNPTLTEGAHTLTATSTDLAGNVSGVSEARSITIDTTVPSVAISSPAASAVTADSTPAISFTASDSTGVSISCGIDGGDFEVCSSPWTIATALDDGVHTASVLATDGAGNQNAASVSFVVDTTAPGAPVILVPASDGSVGDTTPTITGLAEIGSSVTVVIDGSTACEATATDSGTWSCSAENALNAGEHTLSAHASDTAGNTSPSTTERSFTVDLIPPDAPSLIAPSLASTIANSAPPVVGNSEPYASVSIVIDGHVAGEATANDVGLWSWSPPRLADGPHSVHAIARDAAGNASDPSSTVNFTIDTTAPAGNVTQRSGGARPVFDIGSNDASAGSSCVLDSAPATQCGSSFSPATDLNPGTHTLVVTWIDAIGNRSQQTVTFVVSLADIDPLPSACFAKGVLITDLVASGSKVTIRGFARLSHRGERVTVRYQPKSSKIAGSATVQTDGSFVVKIKAPKKSLWTSAKTRYRATVGKESTPWTALARRVRSVTASYSGGKLTVKGTLTKPLLPGANAAITARVGCGSFKSLGSTPIKSNGTFSVTMPYPQSPGVAFVKVDSVVSSGGKRPKPVRTSSFLIPVIIR